MDTEQTVILIHPDAPAKPPWGAACNGCGVCCLWAPCPLGVVLSGRRTGGCRAVRWNADQRQYQCGAVTAPREVLSNVLPGPLEGLAGSLAFILPRMALRWIAAGAGCDSSVEVAAPLSPTIPAKMPTTPYLPIPFKSQTHD